jgi:uncharacterized protein involved in type VI secretion and phage assembly
MNAERRFYGKFRGKVTDNDDKNKLGRLRAQVIEVYGTNDSPWAMPSVPYAGDGVGLLLLPPVGASVWFEFEHGDPDTPIWSGCFWLGQQTQSLNAGSPAIKILKTDTVTITIDDSQSGQGKITIATAANASLTIQGSSITLDNGSNATVGLSGSTVQINGSALEIT